MEMCRNKASEYRRQDGGGKRVATGGTGDTGVVRRDGRQVQMQEADKIDGRAGPETWGVTGNLTLLTNAVDRRHWE
jgi:hypothetical protein